MTKDYTEDFENYIRHTEPEKKEKSYAWATAIGLQQVDGLTPSKYLYDTARRNIEGEISIDQAKNLIDGYYKSKTQRNDDEDDRTEEADKVSSRIAQILSEPSFNFSPSYLISIHRRLFEGIYKFAGIIRDYDITKNEWVLNGDTVMYGAAFELKEALNYDFEMERAFSYKNISKDELVKHITFFVSRLWQIHAFGEGNTRTTAVFTIKYLRSLGFNAENDIFAKNSWYFRNALVRANYTNVQKEIAETSEYLERFFRNLLLGENNELKNRYCHIDYKLYVQKADGQSSPKSSPKSGLGSPKSSSKLKTSDKIINLIKSNPKITTQEIAENIGITKRAVLKNLSNMKDRVIHTGPYNGGSWEILENR